MLEEFDVPAFYLCKDAVLSIFATGKYTGNVVDVGDHVTNIVPVS